MKDVFATLLIPFVVVAGLTEVVFCDKIRNCLCL